MWCGGHIDQSIEKKKCKEIDLRMRFNSKSVARKAKKKLIDTQQTKRNRVIYCIK